MVNYELAQVTSHSIHKIHKIHKNTQSTPKYPRKRIKILCECITGKESGSHYSKNVLYNGDQKWLLVLKNGMYDERGIFSIALHTLSNF